ncbi:MAG: hypothetical protein ACOC41_07715 [Chitinivibrionales bacterium]
MRSRRSKTDSSFTKAIILAAVLVLAFFMYTKIGQNGLPRQLFNLFQETDIDYRQLAQFSEEQKDSIKKAIAGFWVYDSDTLGSDNPVSVHDRIELKDNGIIWRVKQHRMRLPSGAEKHWMHISHAYLNPYAVVDSTTGEMAAEVRIIRQVLVTDRQDTCYGESFVDEVWKVRGDSTSFSYGGRNYQSYAQGDLTRFFPRGVIHLVDSVSFEQCDDVISFPLLARAAVATDLLSLEKAEHDPAQIQQWIDQYYIPYCLRPVLGGVPGDVQDTSDTDSLTMRLMVNAKGETQDIKVRSPLFGMGRSRLKQMAEGEIAMWRFPPASSESEPVEIEQSMRF